jgi:hypothetical protein
VDGDPVYVDGELVTARRPIEFNVNESNENNLKLLVVSNEHAVTGSFIYIAEFNSLSFYDFANIPNPSGDGVDYESFAWPHPETLGDLQRSKAATYVHCFFQRTENKYYQVGLETLYDRESGCILVGTWEWQDKSSKRSSQAQQVYRFRIPPKLEGGNVVTREDVVIKKSKVRGQGRSFAPHFSSVTGKDFVLLGYSVPYTADQDAKE